MYKCLLLSYFVLIHLVYNGESIGNINSLALAVRNAIDLALRESSTGANVFQSDAGFDKNISAEFNLLGVMVWPCTICGTKQKNTIPSARLGQEREYHAESSGDLREIEPVLLMEWRTRIAPVCTLPEVICDPYSPYRTVDGKCNNLKLPLLGSWLSPQGREITPFYADGLNLPRSKSVTGLDLPSPRLISNVVHSNTGRSPVLNRRNTNMFFAYGQFLDHDVTLTPVLQDNEGKNLECCRPGGLRDPRCFPIPVPPNDPMFQICKNFVRSASRPPFQCDPSPRYQINQLTSFIDGSTIYSSTREQLDILREKRFGRIKLTAMNLPQSGSADMCTLSSPGHHCFLAGDGRRHEVPTLTTFHVIFSREHNHLARGLQMVNPHWSDERLFQEARRIMGAELQHIAFNEYLPLVLGNDVIKTFSLLPASQGYRNIYDVTVDPSSTSVFSTAAFRFGHSQIPSVLGMMAKDHKIIDEMPLHTQFDRPDIFFNRDGSESLMRWLANSHHEENDRLISDSVRNLLTLNMDTMEMDLSAANIQRGRDHGIPPYNVWREWCGLRSVLHFGQGPGGLVDHDSITGIFLSKVYRHPNDLDLFTAGVSEKSLPGASVGPTFACIIAKQFRKYQAGDRFYYENSNLPGSFTLDQLNEIKRTTTLAAIQCRNSRIQATQPFQFLKPDPQSNPKIPCQLIPTINLRFWREHSPLVPIVPLTPVKFLQVPTVLG
ncbi:peroxidase-like protein [Argopecten irradians]|uniref:peroxidase-like protein n=1 Tax=Argopecten irradians TaxID=31199 RepID=UPI003716D6B3